MDVKSLLIQAAINLFCAGIAGVVVALFGRRQRIADLRRTEVETEKLQLEIEDLKRSARQRDKSMDERATALESKVASGLQRLLVEEVHPQIWKLLTAAHGLVKQNLSVFRQGPDLDKWAPLAVEECLRDQPWTESQKQGVLQASSKTAEYDRVYQAYEIHNLRQAFVALRDYKTLHQIRLEKEIVDLLESALKAIWNAIVCAEIYKPKHGWGDLHEAQKEFDEKFGPVEKQLETLLRARVRGEEPSRAAK